MTLILDAPPYVPPTPVPPPLVAHSASLIAWTVYTRSDARQNLPEALRESFTDHLETRGTLTAVLLADADEAALVPVAQEVGLLIYVGRAGGVRVQPGTWGLL